MLFLLPKELSVRTEASGGDVALTVEHGPGGGPDGRSRIVLLVHGYDNSVKGARGAYAKFRDNFANELAQSAAGQSILADTFEFLWPGDKAWPPLLHYLSYPLEIAPARNSGKTLARFLRSLSGPGGTPVSVFVIAHSLGNRVLLELLKELKQLQSVGGARGQVDIDGVCMMAAAVPVAKVEPGGELHEASVSARTCVLSSEDDTVLHLAFPPGETVAGDGFFPTAIGRFGQPKDQWHEGQPMPGYGHSDYWQEKATVEPVARFLGQVVPNRLPVSSIGTNSIQTTELPTNTINSLSAAPHV